MRACCLLFVAGLIVPLSAGARGDVGNGNFSAGNTGFSSGYTFASVDPSTGAGHFTVATSPLLFNSFGASFGDHTTGTGPMLILDGSSQSGVVAWSQVVSLAPNTNYQFSAFAASWGEVGDLHDPSPAIISFTVNGSQVGSTLNLPATDGQWAQYQGSFNSGALTFATLGITDLNTVSIGNDFAIDDISLSGPSAPIPEPACIAILGCGSLALLGRIRRYR